MANLFLQISLFDLISDIKSKRVVWHNKFQTGGEAWDFFCAISSSFQYDRYPISKRLEDYNKVREYCNGHNKIIVTDDIILAYGKK